MCVHCYFAAIFTVGIYDAAQGNKFAFNRDFATINRGRSFGADLRRGLNGTAGVAQDDFTGLGRGHAISLNVPLQVHQIIDLLAGLGRADRDDTTIGSNVAGIFDQLLALVIGQADLD